MDVLHLIYGSSYLVCTFLQKKKHHQLKTVLCGRCVLLSQGAMIPAVSGNGGYGEGKGFISADDLRAQLTHLRYDKALIVKLVRSLFQLCELFRGIRVELVNDF